MAKKTENELLGMIKEMNIQEKIIQLSCTIPLTIQESGRISFEKMKQDIPQGLGRMTQFASGFFKGGRQAAQEYNVIQDYNLKHERHAIPILMQNEAIGGLVAAQATAFPIPLAVASTWESKYAYEMGAIIDEEARAIGIRMILAPVADVARDARWGRVGETYGEDPLLVTRFSVEMCSGLQQNSYGEHVVACAKHFLGYAASEAGINKARTCLARKELLEIHGMPFAGMIKEANLQGVMVTYNEIDGLPMSVNEEYTKRVLKEEYGFNGTAICDAMSIPSCHLINGIGKSMEEVVGWALKAGIDADTPITSVYQKIEDGIKQNLVKEEDVNQAVLRILRQKNDLGLFEKSYVDPNMADEIFHREKSKQVSKEIANKGIILLKNQNNILPLQSNTKKIMLLGPFANRISPLFGDYSYVKFIEMFANSCLNKSSTMEGVATFFDKIVDKKYVKSILNLNENIPYSENIERYVRTIYDAPTLFETMVDTFKDSEIIYHNVAVTSKNQEINELCMQARDCEVIIVTGGEVSGFGEDATSGEGKNNGELKLPAYQVNLLKELKKLKKPIIFLLFNARPLLLLEIEAYCDVILEVWYPGPYGAQGICDVISGKENPGGKLPMTFPKYAHQCPIYYGNKAGSGYLNMQNTYNNAVEEPLYSFGYGLSYTTFTMTLLNITHSVEIGGTVTLKVRIENTGDIDGDETIQVYSSTIGASVVRPVKELRAFKRLFVPANEKRDVTFVLHTLQFGYYDRNDKFVLEPANMLFMVGNNAHNIQFDSMVKLIGETLDITRKREFSFDVSVE